MNTKHLLITGLLCGLAGGTATAQMSSPSQNDPNQAPGVSTPGTPPTFPTERQEKPDNQQAPPSDKSQMPPADQSQTPQSDKSQLPQSDQDNPPQTTTDSASDYKSKLQSQLQEHPSLAGVQVNYTDTTVELTGSVPSDKDKHQARMIAQNFANGRKVVDHITVAQNK